MSWTLTKKLDAFAGPGEIKRREVVLDPQVSPEEIKSREVELDLRAGLLSPHLFLRSRAMDIVFVTLFCTTVETAIAWYTSCSTMVSGHCLNILLFWWQSQHPWSSGLVPAIDLHSPPPHPPHPIPVPNKQSHFCGC